MATATSKTLEKKTCRKRYGIANVNMLSLDYATITNIHLTISNVYYLLLFLCIFIVSLSILFTHIVFVLCVFSSTLSIPFRKLKTHIGSFFFTIRFPCVSYQCVKRDRLTNFTMYSGSYKMITLQFSWFIFFIQVIQDCTC